MHALYDKLSQISPGKNQLCVFFLEGIRTENIEKNICAGTLLFHKLCGINLCSNCIDNFHKKIFSLKMILGATYSTETDI